MTGVPRAWSVTFRLLFLQGAWNFRRFQNIGWAWSLQPALRAIYPDPARHARALRRHLELFNTHPVMASFLAGALLKAESGLAHAEADLEAESRLSTVKVGWMSPLAGLGDTFFWSGVRPLAGILGVGWAWLGPRPAIYLAPWLLLLAYNPVALLFRVWGLRSGWREGWGLGARLHRLGLPRLVEALRSMAFCVVAGMGVCLGRFAHPVTGEAVPMLDNFLFVGSGFLMLLLLRLRVHPLAVLGLAMAAGLLSAQDLGR